VGKGPRKLVSIRVATPFVSESRSFALARRNGRKTLGLIPRVAPLALVKKMARP
jgi:hypothetical protein